MIEFNVAGAFGQQLPRVGVGGNLLACGLPGLGHVSIYATPYESVRGAARTPVTADSSARHAAVRR
jgi:hypothetical protein